MPQCGSSFKSSASTLVHRHPHRTGEDPVRRWQEPLQHRHAASGPTDGRVGLHRVGAICWSARALWASRWMEGNQVWCRLDVWRYDSRGFIGNWLVAWYVLTRTPFSVSHVTDRSAVSILQRLDLPQEYCFGARGNRPHKKRNSGRNYARNAHLCLPQGEG